MKKFFAFIFFILFLTNTLALLLTLNFKLGFMSAPQVKYLISESGAYDLIAAEIREGLVDNAGSQIKEGTLFEIISETVNAPAIQKIAENSIDQFFAIIENPKGDQSVNISLSDLERQLNQTLQEKSGLDQKSIEAMAIADVIGSDIKLIDFNNNPTITYLANINLILIVSAILSLIYLTIFFLFVGTTASARFAWSGTIVFFTGLILLSITLAGYYLIPQLVDLAIDQLNLSDPKIANGFRKVTENVLAGQKIYFTIETAAFLLVGLFSIIFSRGIREAKVNVLDDKAPLGNI